MWPPALSEGFNVVVAEFVEIDENGRIHRTEQAQEISEELFRIIEQETAQLPSTLRVQLRPPNLVGIIKGETANERADNAEKNRCKTQKRTILIYGVISIKEGEQHLELEFYVSDESFGYGSEVAGPDRLGKPIGLADNLSPKEQFELNEELKRPYSSISKSR